MEQHNGDDPRDTDEAWHQVADTWSNIGDRLRDRYQDVVGDQGPSESEVREAFKTLGTAAQAVFDSIGSAMKDPEVRSQVKDAVAGFASAMGQTFNDLGEEIRRVTNDGTAPAPDPDGSPEPPITNASS